MKVFDKDGHVVDMPGTAPVNDLTQAPTFDEMPPNVEFIPAVIMAADGVTPRIVLVSPSALVMAKDLQTSLVEAVNKSREGLVADFRARDVAIEAVNTRQDAFDVQIKSVVDGLVARKAPIPLTDVTITATELVTLIVVEKSISKTLTGVKTTDVLVLTPKQMPAGYGLRGYSIASDGNILIKVQCPILSSGGTGIVFSALVFR